MVDWTDKDHFAFKNPAPVIRRRGFGAVAFVGMLVLGVHGQRRGGRVDPA